MTSDGKHRPGWAVLPVLLILVAACTSTEVGPFPQPDRDYSDVGLSDAEAATLLSIEKVDDFPLYTMHHYAAYDYEEFEGALPAMPVVMAPGSQQAWACSLFAALADPDSRLFGRNFDWSTSPTVLLFTDPPDGYASATLVDIAYLGFRGDPSGDLADRPIEDLKGLLNAPYTPFDGLNEAGLAIAMAAVPDGQVVVDPSKDTIGSLGIIRLMLDKASTVEEAVELLIEYNIDFEGGPPLHYLMADRNGDSMLVEFYQGEVHLLRGEQEWNLATNFLRVAVDSPDGQSIRYDLVSEALESSAGRMDFDAAFELLELVSQPDTQWSVVYSTNTGEIRVVMGRTFEQVYTFELPMLED